MARAIFCLLLIAAALSLSCSERSSADLQMPREISARVMDSVVAYVWKGEVSNQEDFNALRNRFARMFVDSMRTRDIDDRETITCAQVLHWSGRSGEAEKLLKPLTVGDGRTARRASRELVTLNIEEGRFEEAERLIREYRRNFPPDPEVDSGMHMCVDDIAMRYNNSGRPEEAVRIMLEELDHLPFDYPYSSLCLFHDLIPLMTELGRLDELRERIDSCRTKMEEALAAHLSKSATEDSTSKEHEELADRFESWIRYFGEVPGWLDMIGRQAPELEFVHVFNADPALRFEQMRGKVTLLDFWATWCVACVIGYQEVGKLYTDYKDRGLVVLGVTSTRERKQGEDTICYPNPEQAGLQGDQPFTEQEEIELLGSYIEKHRMTWPCGVLDTLLKETEYKIGGLPTYVILDRDGMIRYLHIGVGKEQQLRRIIEKMLGEDVAWRAD